MNVPIGPAVDPGSGRIYWGNANPENKISYANLDGSGGADLNTAGATVNNPHGVAIDPVANRIYWANVFVGVISYANLNGTGGGNLNTSGATVSNPVGMAIDPSARKIYWGNEAGNKISFANLDGSGGGDLSTTGATLNGSRSPALLKAPGGSGVPAIAGGSTAGSVLTCSQGSWSPDLLGSFLYRVPQSFAYSWTLNGADIPGASANTYTASATGDYRCTVTASNPAGSASQTSAAHAVSPLVTPPAAPTLSATAATARCTSAGRALERWRGDHELQDLPRHRFRRRDAADDRRQRHDLRRQHRRQRHPVLLPRLGGQQRRRGRPVERGLGTRRSPR